MPLKKGYKKLLEEADAMVKTVSAAEARDLAGSDVLFVDLRDPRELEREGRIPGSFHCPRGMLEFWLDPESPYHKPILAEGRRMVFYCAAGWRSALSAKTAVEMGVENVSHLGGGFAAWKEAGGPVEPMARRG